METLRQDTIGSQLPVSPHVLVMEDELNVARGLKMVLTEEGCEVDVAMTGQSALDKFRERRFDLLLADLRLPDIDGMEVIKRVRKDRPETEAIVITGYASVSSAVESVKNGVFDYLRKPFTEDELKTAVKGALKKKQQASFEQLLNETERKRLVQKQEVIRVLDRTSQDLDFWREMQEKGSEALEGYQLSLEAKTAIVSGDLEWIKKHVGKLTQKQLMFIYRCLEREAW